MRNNNPLNIERSKGRPWRGEVVPSRDGRFAQFESRALGYRAAFKLLDNYRTKHGCRVLADFINRWAPPAENATDTYVSVVARRAGIPEESVIDTRDGACMRRIIAAMTFVENGVEADAQEVLAGWELFREP